LCDDCVNTVCVKMIVIVGKTPSRGRGATGCEVAGRGFAEMPHNYLWSQTTAWHNKVR
jgi:hypothetical protein